MVSASAATFAAAGATVEEASPDLSLADDAFRTLRAWQFQAAFGELLAEHPESFKAVAGRQHPRGGVGSPVPTSPAPSNSAPP